MVRSKPVLAPIVLVIAACAGRTTSDASVEIEDADADVRAISTDAAEASPKQDVAPPVCEPPRADASFGDAMTCRDPLTIRVDFDAAPLPAWCLDMNGYVGDAGVWIGQYQKSTCACDGYLAILYGHGTDTPEAYLFDATTKQLVAHLGGLGMACVEGPSTFARPRDDCDFYEWNVSGFGFVDLECPAGP
jgi:hypothetical protein